MTPATIAVVIHPRGKPIQSLPREVQIALNASTEELYTSLAEATALSIHRLRITNGSDCRLIPNSRKFTIKEVGVKNKSRINVKDLGPQVSWRTVFIAEYLGPVIIPGLFLFPLRPYLYRTHGTITEPSNAQRLLCVLLTIHFVKREYESIFVHRFSNATMPARNIARNSGYYCVMSCNMAYWMFRPNSATATVRSSPALLYAGVALFVFGELANLNAHLVLRDLRRAGTTDRGVPCGFGFDAVTCPNYLFEIIAWVGIYLVSGLSWSVLMFIIIGSVQMGIWARKKERRYREEFGDRYKRKRFVMLPGFI
ncbi:3-oxo-5-alpha-steroid 4-dehydrogenase-domain-containing protein [Aspergillus bertholletiae]|uniref:very-long-chain enoyl-CoA reductase n=1 Tax=Aspergillus bertholletiae TaxID=1226010 RepID=A0A5N7B979_9EURO|nr:3-oxo-5-alpha-steroid 4-dehydrogenase-domain-containing protein [Aspergillus bertholletiae]